MGHSMGSEILINHGLRETRLARMENGSLVEIHIERTRDRQITGNIYKGRVSRVLPGMQAAFVDIGLPKSAFLYVSHILDPKRAESNDSDLEPVAHHEDEHGSGDDDDADAPERQNHANISELVQEGQTILVQVIKEPIGTKGARLTGFVSLPGRYLVFLPDTRQIGVSRRIEDESERNRLKSVIEKHRTGTGGFIVRTVAEGASEKNLKDDMEYLVKLWGTVKKTAQKAGVPSLVYSDLDLATRIIRDRVSDDVERIVVDDANTHKHLTKFVQSFLPKFKKRIELYSEKKSLFEHFGLETEISRALARKVWLKSGGYIVIDETEALSTVDVNTGRFVGKRNLEETILQTNLEAAKEIAYQIRLRNLGGIIVLDFIDMNRQQNRERVYQTLQEEFRKDPVKTNVLPVSELGLIEMTRKRTQESLRQKLSSTCPQCDGRGSTKSRETIAYQILRDFEKEGRNSPESPTLALYCHADIASFFAEDDRQALEELEKRLDRRIQIRIDAKLHLDEYEIFSRDI